METLQQFNLTGKPSLDDLLAQMRRAGFGARAVGHAYEVLKRAREDPDCRILLTISGAMSIAQLGGVFAAMAQSGFLHAVVTTGAVITHQLIVELQLPHYQLPADVDDRLLAERQLNRVYDSIEPESNLSKLHTLVTRIAENWTGPLSSPEIVRRIAAELHTRNGWIAQCSEHRIPVFVPALTDSELGLSLHATSRRRAGGFSFDPMMDLDEFAEWIQQQKRLAVITLGGGVPRNWAMQMIPYLRGCGAQDLPAVRAGVRICPDSPVFGHLSGSTYSEAVTWGKLRADDLSEFAEVAADATIVFPLLILALLNHT